MNSMPMSERNLAFTDIETTGLDPINYEIIEIGLVLARQDSLEILDTLDVKIRPTRPDRIDPKAVERNGYNEKDWEDAGNLQQALALYSEKVEDARKIS